MRFSLAFVTLLAACGGEPKSPAKLDDDHGPPPRAAASPSAASPSPSPPPLPLENKDAFFIINIPAPAPAAGAKICATDADCDALLPKDAPFISRRWTEESWVVVTTPADHRVANVVSDGKAATVILEKSCPGFAERLTLWRVAPTVKSVKITPNTTPPKCPAK